MSSPEFSQNLLSISQEKNKYDDFMLISRFLQKNNLQNELFERLNDISLPNFISNIY